MTSDSTDDLIPWLRSVWDSLERLALAVQKETGPQWPAGDEYSSAIHTDEAGPILTAPYDGDLSWELRQYLSALGPKAVLDDIAAKRRILALHEHQRFAALPSEWPDHWKVETLQAFPGTAEPYVGCVRCDWNSDFDVVEPDWWCEHVRLLALPYAALAGYQERWRP